jgi:hypothetical protein
MNVKSQKLLARWITSSAASPSPEASYARLESDHVAAALEQSHKDLRTHEERIAADLAAIQAAADQSEAVLRGAFWLDVHASLLRARADQLSGIAARLEGDLRATALNRQAVRLRETAGRTAYVAIALRRRASLLAA